jgi:hypothetical protein
MVLLEHLGEPVKKFIDNLWEHNENTKIQKHLTRTSYMVPTPLPLSFILGREAYSGFYAWECPMFQIF